MSYYQKYRPSKVSDLNLFAVRDSLQAILKSGKVSHAYLFVGPRGSGKTSTARILSQVVNCDKNKNLVADLLEPCGECEACKTIISGGGVDVIEIDAASNGLVEDIRDLREKVRLSPIQLRKKIYIIDEVHMVSTAGFNALLKTLEEPPAHAMFVLCTTESHKVPETIVSRCTKINFTKANRAEMVDSLQKVIGGEGLAVSAEACNAIADMADGSFREAHKLLEQLASFGVEITEELVNEKMGGASRVLVKKIIESALSGNPADVVEGFIVMEKQGVKAQVVLAAMLAYLKTQMETAIRSGANIKTIISLIDGLVNSSEKIKVSPDPLLPLETAILEISLNQSGGNGGKVIDKKEDSEKPEVANVVNTRLNEVVEIVKKVDVEDRVVTTENLEETKASIEKIKEEWGVFLDNFAASNGSLAGMLRNSSPMDLKGKSLTLSVRSRFHQDMLERDVKKKIIEQEMERVWGPVTLKTVLVEGQIRTEALEEDNNLNNGPVSVEEIFGT